MKYYIYKIFERNGNYEYTHKCLTAMPDDAEQTPEEFLEETARTFYSDSEDKEDNYWWHFGELVTRGDEITEVTKEEYDILQKYIY